MRALSVSIGLVALATFAGCSVAGVPGDGPGAGGSATVDLETLTASAWTLRSGVGPNGPVQPVDGSPITITFGEGVVGGSGGCNSYRGSLTLDGSQVAFGPLATTRRACQQPIMSTESAYVAALGAAETISLVDGDLILSGPSIQLTFERS